MIFILFGVSLLGAFEIVLAKTSEMDKSPEFFLSIKKYLSLVLIPNRIAFLDLLENESRNTIFGKNAIQKVQTIFSNGLIAEQNLAFYQTVIDKKK